MTNRHTKNHRLYRKRANILNLARKMARSGEHADHTTIIPLLEQVEGFEVARARFEEDAIRAQLDKLCAMARAVDSATPRESNEA